MRKFIDGKYEGTRLEIMPSKPAERLPNSMPIDRTVTKPELNALQQAHVDGNVDVHAPQVFEILNENDKTVYRYEGPSIAQEWKILNRGERPFYRNMGRA